MLGPITSASSVAPSPEAGPGTQSSQCGHPVTPLTCTLLGCRCVHPVSPPSCTPPRYAGACTRSARRVHPLQDRRVKRKRYTLRLGLGSRLWGARHPLTLQEERIVSGPRLQPRGQRGVIDGEALPGLDQRVVVQAGGAGGVQARREVAQLLVTEELAQHRAACVGGAAHQPRVTCGVARRRRQGSGRCAGCR